jgi:5-methylcytosine-specific restriction endonuclease McrA
MATCQMKFKLEEYHRDITDDNLIADLKRVASENNKSSVTRKEYAKKGRYGGTTFVRRFGNWSQALEKAGLQKSNIGIIVSDEDLFKNLEEVWIKLGRQPKYSDMQKPLSRYTTKPYETHFRTWRNALENFVTSVNAQDDNHRKEIQNKLDTKPRKTSRNINWRLRFKVMKRDNFRCQSCGRSPATDFTTTLEVDHIIPWSRGGETTLDNLQTLCARCNNGKSNN